MTNNETGWGAEEFAEAELGDVRLNSRLICLCSRFSETPESPINQACKNWAETKAAYRFFKNKNVAAEAVFSVHWRKTVDRIKGHNAILALQDTSYLVYTSHGATTGLGSISLKKGKNIDRIYSKGLILHTCLGVTTDGLPLGLLDQQIFARELRNKEAGKARPNDILPIEEKESYRWLTALKNANKGIKATKVITVCDREADFYDLFREAQDLSAPILVRASTNRPINRRSRYTNKDTAKLWEYMTEQSAIGTWEVAIAKRGKTKHNNPRDCRVATVEVKLGNFLLNPPRNHIKHRIEQLPDISMTAVYVREINVPEEEDTVEWMLLTNLKVDSFEDACEKVNWYAMRWKIKMFFKVLKSGFRVEECRLGAAAPDPLFNCHEYRCLATVHANNLSKNLSRIFFF